MIVLYLNDYSGLRVCNDPKSIRFVKGGEHNGKNETKQM